MLVQAEGFEMEKSRALMELTSNNLFYLCTSRYGEVWNGY